MNGGRLLEADNIGLNRVNILADKIRTVEPGSLEEVLIANVAHVCAHKGYTAVILGVKVNLCIRLNILRQVEGHHCEENQHC